MWLAVLVCANLRDFLLLGVYFFKCSFWLLVCRRLM